MASTAPSGNEVTLSDNTIKKSESFIGQWNQLISTTNWDKGEIISSWRASLKKSNAAVNEYSDEAWCQLVGGVSPQHVGRLRRTFDRFGQERHEYKGLYWSHFYAALDWDDAEMWLEGAIQNKWSISQMRHQRWETLGSNPGDQPRASDVVATELAEESQTLALSEQNRQNDRNYVEGPVYEGPDFGEEGGGNGKQDSGERQKQPTGTESDGEVSVTETTARPFETFTDLPEDVLDAVNAFKIAIITHKTSQWEEVSRDDMLDVLDSLKQLVRSES